MPIKTDVKYKIMEYVVSKVAVKKINTQMLS